jgi:hypothetical protein
LLQQAGAVAAGLAHADDAAAAGAHAGVAHIGQGVEALLVGAGGDDLVVVVRAGVEVVIVVVEAGVLQGHGLVRRQHAQGGAGLQAQGLHAADHGGQLGQVAVLQVAPGGAHAEALRPVAGLARALAITLVGVHQLLGLHAGLEVGRLAAIAAVLGAAAGLDRQQLRQLHLGGVEPAAVHVRRPGRPAP